MEDLLPEKRPYMPRFFKRLTLLVGDPLDVSRLRSTHAENAVLLRKKVTDLMQEAMRDIKVQAEEIHNEWKCSLPIRTRTL